MAVLDDIAAEKQRIGDRLARVDAERERLAQQLAELDAAERVLSRMTPGGERRGRRGRKAEAAAGAQQDLHGEADKRRRQRSRQHGAEVLYGAAVEHRRNR